MPHFLKTYETDTLLHRYGYRALRVLLLRS
jgi:hypothetical protein